MARTISQYQTAPFTTPQNGQPADATQVLGNDNTVRTSINSHDADSGIHFQSSTLAARPIAGTAGRKWFTEDTYKLFYDDGSAWQEVGYLPIAGGTVTGALTVSGITVNGVLTAANGSITSTNNLTLASSSSNAVVLSTGGTSRWQVANAGHFQSVADNSYDIGDVAANRPRHIYAGTSVEAPTFVGGSVQGPGIIVAATGSNAISLTTNALTRWSVMSTGHMLCGVDNSYDIGATAGSQRPRTIYVGTDVQVGVGGTQITTNAVKIGGVQVVGGRQTSWTNMTGTANQSTSYDTSTITLVQLAQRVWAIQQALTNAGTIGP